MRLILLSLAGVVLYSAPADDPSLTLGTKGNRTQFRMGEQIDVELRFGTKSPGPYRMFSSSVDRRHVRQREYDSFKAEPQDGVVDPLGDSGTLMNAGFARGPFPQALETQLVIVPGIVNDWLSFRRAGHYRIVAESERLFRQGREHERITVMSNTIEIDIVPADPEWQTAQVAEAQALLALAVQQSDSASGEAIQRAARTLRYLETRDAVAPLARFYTSPLHEIQEELRAALTASPHRSEVIARMEEAIAAPDVPISASFLATLMQIEYARRHGAREPMPRDDVGAMKRWNEADRVYMERFRPIQEHFNAKLAEALPRKRGEARAIAFEGLLMNETQTAAPHVRKIILDEFTNLPAPVQARLLMRWVEIGGPEWIPALRSIASKAGESREQALAALMEVDPAAARSIVVDRIRRREVGDPRGSEPRLLLELPDNRLPDLDDALVAALDHGIIGPALVARYASDEALPRVLEWLQQNPQSFCYTAISAYLFRVDPWRARNLLADARKSGSCPFNLPQYAIWQLMSPQLEQAALESLSVADPMVRKSAQALLQHGGSAASKKVLFGAFSALRHRPMGPMETPRETGYVDALIQGAGWVLTTEELDDVEGHCITTNCRQFAQSQRRFLSRPVALTILLNSPWQVMVGGTLTFSHAQTLDKLKQFPSGTAFQLPEATRLKASTIWQRRLERLKALVSEAGMTLVVH